MPPLPDDQEAPATPVVPAGARELLENAELVDVRPIDISASLAEGVSPGARVAAVRIDAVPNYAVGLGAYGNRFDYRFEMLAEDESAVATVTFSLVVDYAVGEDYLPDAEAADFVTTTTGFFAAYPYARELVQSLTARLQVDAVVLGMLKRGTMRPGSVTIAPFRADESSNLP